VPRGGKRAGAGRKADAVREYNAKMQAAVRACVNEEDVQTLTLSTLARAKAGDADARKWISAWILGAEPKQVTVEDNDGTLLRIIIGES
jgi:hypothetical protein